MTRFNKRAPGRERAATRGFALRHSWLPRSLVMCALLAWTQPGHAADDTASLRASDLLDSIGVNIHMVYTDTAYADVVKVQKALAFAGIHQVRNLLQSRSVDPAGGIHLNRLATTCGCRFTFIATDPDLPRAMAWLDRFSGQVPGSIMAVEGPNEVDHWPVAYAGGSGRDAAVAYQRDLYQAVHADAHLAGVSVYSLTGLGRWWTQEIADIVDFANEHPYARNGAPPSARLLTEIDATHRQLAPSRPMVVTETGYPTLLGHPEIKFGRDGVSEDVQARFTLDTLLDFKKAGVAKTFLYELLDEKPDPDGRAIEMHYGLFNGDGTPKKAAVALHNLSEILSDPGQQADRFALKPTSVAISDLPAHGNSLILQKSDGSLQAVIWAEPAIWDAATGTMTQSPATQVKVRFGQPAATVRIYDPIAGAAPLQHLSNASEVAVEVTDHPVVVDVMPARP